MSSRCLWARMLRLVAGGVGMLVEATVSDEAQGTMGTLHVDPVLYITAVLHLSSSSCSHTQTFSLKLFLI